MTILKQRIFILKKIKDHQDIIIKIICQIIENVILNLIVNKQYPYLKKSTDDSISKETEKSIFKKIKGLFFHKVGNFFVWGTDNILLSSAFRSFAFTMIKPIKIIIKSCIIWFIRSKLMCIKSSPG